MTRDSLENGFFFGEPVYIYNGQGKEKIWRIIQNYCTQCQRLDCSKYLEAFYQIAVKQENVHACTNK